MTKKEYDKQWRLANKEHIKQYDKQRYQDNPEYAKEYSKQQHQLLKLSYHIVYLLPAHNDVGVTINPYKRMAWHRSEFNRNTDNWIELARYTDREEALLHEARLHNTGYEGGKVCYNITQEA